jgi:F-type H+-transporting ATPase subunit a
VALALQPLFHGQHVPPYAEAIAGSLITAAVTAVVASALVRNMDRVPGRRQAAMEWVVQQLDGFTAGIIGPESRRYLPLVGTLFIYILLMNLGGLLPFWVSPTANLNVTVALAISVFLFVQFEGIRVNGVRGYLRHFVGEPVWLAPLNFPLHIVGELARPVSLSVRLFGNIFGEDTVIAVLIGLVAPLIIPFKFLPLQFPMLLLALFTSFVQALVFSILTCIYIAGATVHEDDHGITDAGHGALDAHGSKAAA